MEIIQYRSDPQLITRLARLHVAGYVKSVKRERRNGPLLRYSGLWREKMDFETIWYEYTPYIYAIAGIMSILQIGSIIGIAFGVALIAAAGVIIIKRLSYRRRQSNKSERQMSGSR